MGWCQALASVSAAVGQVSTQAPQPTHPLEASGTSPAVAMRKSGPRPNTCQIDSPCTSSQMRTQRLQAMQRLMSTRM